ncbi:unnamed protein product [Pylaiella littoralis]
MTSTDRDILLVLYKSTGGASWKNTVNWGTDTPISQWYGVEVNKQDRVVKLSLSSNNLRGQIPARLGSLSTLTVLNLKGNELNGECGE